MLINPFRGSGMYCIPHIINEDLHQKKKLNFICLTLGVGGGEDFFLISDRSSKLHKLDRLHLKGISNAVAEFLICNLMYRREKPIKFYLF